ncbi:hypothetical protein [Pseudoxanthomonas japonensis]|uniref:hypothetical protein n=1 Tax=Pseudoxanthomonas japonensis TaxID=69284 RepID=UPI0037490215
MSIETAAPQADVPAPAPAPAPALEAPPVVGETVTASMDTAPAWPEWAPPLPEDQGELLALKRPPTFEETIAAIDTPAHSPFDYVFPPLLVQDADGMPDGDEMQAIAGVRSMLWHSGLPKVDGDGLMQAIADESHRLGERMDQATFEMHERQSDAALRGIWGDRYDSLRGKLEDLFDELGRKTPGGIEPLLEANWHVLISPLVMNRLLQHVDRLEHRRRK